jgi:hypothetical protein
VVVVSVTPLAPVATVVEDDDVCPKATEPSRTVANAIPTIDLIIRTNFLVTELLQKSQLKAIRVVLPMEIGEPGSKWMRQNCEYGSRPYLANTS